MAVDVPVRGDVVAAAMEQVPDEALLGFSVASIFTSMALYLAGRREEGLFVGVLGTAFAVIIVLMKLLSMERNAHPRP